MTETGTLPAPNTEVLNNWIRLSYFVNFSSLIDAIFSGS